MKQLTLITLCSLMLACSGSTTCTKDAPMPNPVIVPTTEPSVVEPEPEPEPEISWKPFDLTTRDMLRDTGYCALFYFGTSSEASNNHDGHDELTDSENMELTFKVPEVIEAVNDAFVPIRFPVSTCLTNPHCAQFLTMELGITKFPSSIVAYEDENSVTVIGEGYMNAETYVNYLKTSSEKYDSCKALKE